jgi:hypothetical protein
MLCDGIDGLDTLVLELWSISLIALRGCDYVALLQWNAKHVQSQKSNDRFAGSQESFWKALERDWLLISMIFRRVLVATLL